MKLCKDCFYFKELMCYHEKNIKRSPVTGDVLFLNLPLDLRYETSFFKSACGEKGKWFKPKGENHGN